MITYKKQRKQQKNCTTPRTLLMQLNATPTTTRKKRLLPYFSEALYNKKEFIARNMLEIFKLRNEQLPRTSNSNNN